MIGVPTSRPVRVRASSVSSSSTSSQDVSSSAAAYEVGRPAAASTSATWSVVLRWSRMPGAAWLVPVALAVGGDERAERFASEVGAHGGGDAQHPQPGGVAVLVAGRELGGVVLVLVEQAQRDEPPVDGVVGLLGDLHDPARGDPGERADRVPEELDVVGRAGRFGGAHRSILAVIVEGGWKEMIIAVRRPRRRCRPVPSWCGSRHRRGRHDRSVHSWTGRNLQRTGL